MQSSNKRGEAPPWLRAWIGRALLVLGFLVFLAAWSSDSVAVPLTPFRIDSGWLLPPGIILILVGLARVYIPTTLSFSILVFSFLLAASFTIFSKPPKRGDRILPLSPVIDTAPPKTWLGPDEWIILQVDNTRPIGMQNHPSQVGKHHSPEFDVTYTIDETGCRAVPDSNQNARDRVVFVGCSFTFGTGVEDNRTYVNLLARDALRDYRVVNRGTNGWGTTQAAIVVEEEVTSKSKPAAVIYAMIEDHLRRNYLRQNWHRRVGTMAFPLFDRNGTFIDMIERGKEPEAPYRFMEDGPEIDAAEVDVTRALLMHMQQVAKKNGVPFAVVLIGGQWTDRIRSATDIAGLPFIPLHHACDDLYLHDRHPTPRGHRRMAEAMKSAKELSEILLLPKLYRPVKEVDFSDEQPYAVSKVYDISAKTQIRAVALHDGKQGVRFEGIALPHFHAAGLTVARRIDPVVRFGDYKVTFTLRSNSEKKLVGVRAGERTGPFESVSNIAWRRASPVAQEAFFFFRSTRNESHPALHFQLGASSEAVEITNVHVSALLSTDDLLPTLHLEHPDDTSAWSRSIVQKDDPYRLRVEEIDVPSGETWHSQIRAYVGDVEADQTYRLTGELKADAPKKVGVGLAEFGNEYRELAWYQEISLNADPTSCNLEFTVRSASREATLVINIGHDSVPIEVGHLRLRPKS